MSVIFLSSFFKISFEEVPDSDFQVAFDGHVDVFDFESDLFFLQSGFGVDIGDQLESDIALGLVGVLRLEGSTLVDGLCLTSLVDDGTLHELVEQPIAEESLSGLALPPPIAVSHASTIHLSRVAALLSIPHIGLQLNKLEHLRIVGYHE